MIGVSNTHIEADERLLMAIRESCLREYIEEGRDSPLVTTPKSGNVRLNISLDSISEAQEVSDRSIKVESEMPTPPPVVEMVSPRPMKTSSRKSSISIINKRLSRMVFNTFNAAEHIADDVSDDSGDGGDGEDKQIMRYCRLRILDARSNIAAQANTLKGAGYENVARLGGQEITTIKFANIANIHSVRESLVALRSVCGATDKSAFHYRLSDSKWLHHLSDILGGAVYMCQMLERGEPVLVHCSDGWDRTSQLSALSQLLLDPYYRTIDGFRHLVHKEFILFGHQFGTRTSGEANEHSPVFIQFLDAGICLPISYYQ
jgi:rhodanese-related sulfurtransferase